MRQRRVPQNDWQWDKTETGCRGVNTLESGYPVWYTFSGNPHGSNRGGNQTYADFRKNGPKVAGAPAEVLAEISDLLHKALD